MSYRQLFRGVWARILRQQWGTRIAQPDGSDKDTGVNQFAEEMAAILASEEPIKLDGPIEFKRQSEFPLFKVVDDFPLDPFEQPSDDAEEEEDDEAEAGGGGGSDSDVFPVEVSAIDSANRRVLGQRVVSYPTNNPSQEEITVYVAQGAFMPAVGDVVWAQSIAGEQGEVYLQVHAPSPTTKHYVVLEEQADYLVCQEYQYAADSLQPPVHSHGLSGQGEEVRIAKPRWLQTSPFDGQTVTLRGVDVSYAYTDIGARSASCTFEGDDWTEEQEITPPYFPGDIITARQTQTGLGFASGEGDEAQIVPITLEDSNTAGRVWAGR